MNDQELHETIEAYLRNTLSAVQREAFEKQLSSDEGLQKLVESHKKADRAITLARHQSAKARLKSLDAELIQPTITNSSRRFSIVRTLSMAAGFLILVIAGFYLYAQTSYSTEAIAEQMFAPVPEEVFRGREEYVTSLGEKFAQAEQLFREKKYDDARQIYLFIIKEDSMLKEQAEWNLLLSYYAMDPASPQFKILFDRIRMDSRHAYNQYALRLASRMESPLYKIAH
jgi:hypothetical protein